MAACNIKNFKVNYDQFQSKVENVVNTLTNPRYNATGAITSVIINLNINNKRRERLNFARNKEVETSLMAVQVMRNLN